MIDLLPMITKGAIAMMDVYTTIDAVEKLDVAGDDSGDKMIRTANLVNKLTMFGFSIAEIGAILSGAKSSFLHKLKAGELIPRSIQFPLALLTEVENFANNPSIESGIKFAERGVLAPIADMLRVAAEGSFYYEKHFLEMTPEELKTAQRPIIEQDGYDSYRIVGYRPVDLVECSRNIEKFQNIATGSALVRMGAELELGGKAFRLGKNVYGNIASFFIAHGHHLPAIQRILNRVAAPGANQNAPEMRDVFSLQALGFIPAPLHDDAVFSRYICPITQLPIRHPVGDPNGRVLYERSAIYAWLAQRPISPVTRQPLTRQELVERPAVQALIDQRLVHHEGQLWDYLEQNPTLQQQLIAAPPANLDQAANQEHQ